MNGLSRRAHFFERNSMWKITAGFIVFAGLALFILSKGGDIDMSGEKHGDAAPAQAASPAAATASATASAAAVTESAPK